MSSSSINKPLTISGDLTYSGMNNSNSQMLPFSITVEAINTFELGKTVAIRSFSELGGSTDTTNINNMPQYITVFCWRRLNYFYRLLEYEFNGYESII